MRISLDTETTGIDFRHGALPFFVTTCDETGEQLYWEWLVDPETRIPDVSTKDLREIQDVINDSDEIIIHNSRFDVKALELIGVDVPWEKVHDTLLMAHILGSNQPKDLTSLTTRYLGVSILSLEEKLKEAVQKCRSMVRNKGWDIAKADHPKMPSAKEQTWRYDYWLPRAVAEHFEYPEDHPWREVLANYANADSACTIGIFPIMLEEIRERGYENIYQFRRKLPPILYSMVETGVHFSKERLDELIDTYEEETDRSERKCKLIAKTYGRDLVLPKSGTNKVLTQFIFEDLKLPVLAVSGKTGAPSLNKDVLSQYESMYTGNQKEAVFIRNLIAKRKRDTALNYLRGYMRFAFQVDGVTYVLHPSLNMTGTSTLRFSSQNPNEQNISKQEGFNLRYVFGPAPGREWWSLDAKNIELRIPYYKSGEQSLIDLFERPDEPPFYGSNHLLNFSIVYPELWEENLREVGIEKVGPHCKKKYASNWYQWCKNGGFAVQYGAGPETADRAFHKVGAHGLLKSKFQQLELLNQECIRHASRHGYVETFPDKTVDPERGYPLLCTRTEWGSILPTVPLNYRVQGTAMWWMTKAMVRTQEYLDRLNRAVPESGKKYNLVMQIHDEIVLDFPQGEGAEPWKTNLPKILKIMKMMEKGGDDIGVPTPIGCEYHSNNWSEGITLY